MTKERLDKLDSIAFVWEALEEKWNKGFELLSAYEEANGNCLVPQHYKVDGFKLGSWVSVLRKSKTSMIKQKMDKLNSIGFVWDTTEEQWNKGFASLFEYKEANGNCLVPAGYKIDGFNLGSWVNVLRKRKTSQSQKRLDQLNSIGFVWDPHDKAWNNGFELLSVYKEANGNCLVPAGYKVDAFTLGRWVSAQRANKDSMTKERLDKLNSLGFVWDPHDKAWNNGFELLSVYKEANGNCLVPKGYKVDGLNLGQWVSTQRKAITSMTKERADKLNSLGFVWAAK